MHDFSEIERMTLAEYHIRIKAVKLQRLDRRYEIYLQAWVNQQAKATKRNGKPIHRTFEKFFDYEKEEKNTLGIPEEEFVESSLSKLIRKANG